MSDIVNTRDSLMDEIEAIQEYCEENNIGLNEERLEAREMIADMILRRVANGLLTNSSGLNLQRVSNRYTIEDIERCVENWGLCKVEKEHIERFLEV